MPMGHLDTPLCVSRSPDAQRDRNPPILASAYALDLVTRLRKDDIVVHSHMPWLMIMGLEQVNAVWRTLSLSQCR